MIGFPYAPKSEFFGVFAQNLRKLKKDNQVKLWIFEFYGILSVYLRKIIKSNFGSAHDIIFAFLTMLSYLFRK